MKFAMRTAALSLSALLLLYSAGATGAAAETPLSTAQKQEDLNYLYDTLKESHPNLFANSPESDFLARKTEIEASLDDASDLDFALELQSLAALAGDSHTTTQYSKADGYRFFPFSVLWFDGAWRLASVDAAHGDAIGQTVTAVEGLGLDEITRRIAGFASADNPVKLRRQVGQLLYVADILEFLDILQPGADLTLTLQDGSGATQTITLAPLTAAQLREYPSASVRDLQEGQPATAFDRSKYYFSRPLDANTYYIQYNVCQADPELPMADFAAQVAADLEAGGYTQVLLDMRNNGGGSDGVIHPLLNTLAPAVRDGSLRLWAVIGEITYSSAVINAVMVTEMGGYLAGTPTSGSVDHFGSVDGFSLPNSGLGVRYSTKWIDLSTLFEAGLPYDVESLQPDLLIEPTWEDYLAGKDTEVKYLLAHGADYQSTDPGGAPLTRGRFLTQLYEAARAAGKDVSAPESSFRDLIPFAYYAPAAYWAVDSGIVLGDGQGSLSPARPMTRAEAAVLLVRFADYLELSLPQKGAAVEHAPAWAADALERCAGLGLTGDPSGTLSRAQGLALLEALDVKYVKGAS